MLRSLMTDVPVTPTVTTSLTDMPTGRLGVEDGDTVTLHLQTIDGRTVRVSVSRRDIGKLFVGGALRAILPGEVVDAEAAERVSKVLDQPRRVDTQVLDYFQTLLAEHFTADKMLGPRQLVSPVVSQIQVLEELRRHARPGTTEATLRLLAQYAEFAGWLHQDAGDTSAAMWWSDRATQWAQAAGDYEMVADMLVRKSNIALLNRDAIDVIELAAAARSVPGPVSPKLHALAAQQEARGWALHRNPDQFQHRLDVAANLLREHGSDVGAGAPVYLRHYDLATLEEQSASGYQACGHAETAVAILERQIAATAGHLHRDQGHQLAKLANAVLATAHPNPERAADLGLSCVSAARTTGSARIAGELQTLDRTLTKRWPTLSGTVQLREALAAA